MHTNAALPLTPIDYVFTGNSAYPVGFVFHYRYRIDDERLQRALAHILPHFRSAASRLERRAAGEYVLVPHADGLHLETVSQRSEGPADRPAHTYIDSVETRENQPLCRIRLTDTADGSSLAISFSHVVADGFSCFYFLAQLARAFKGQEIAVPQLARDWYAPRPTSLAAPLDNAASIELTGFARHLPRQDLAQSAVAWETLYIGETEIADLLARAAAYTSHRLSRNDVIAAHLWKLYVQKWQRGPAPQVASFALPFDVRRFPAWVSPRYFGNGICLSGGQMAYPRFLEAEPGELALAVRAVVDKVTEEYVRRSYDVFAAVRQQEGLAAMAQFHVSDPEAGILVTNLSRVPLEDIDFGQGAPFSFATIANAPRTAIVLPAEDGVKVDVCLPRDL